LTVLGGDDLARVVRPAGFNILRVRSLDEAIEQLVEHVKKTRV